MKSELIHHTTTFIIGAFSLVAALAWNSTIESIFKHFFNTPDKISAKLIYSIIVTLIVIITIIWLQKTDQRLSKKKRLNNSKIMNIF
ncbi:MAG: DUF5654 family protein [Nanoarchaeota archaeon]